MDMLILFFKGILIGMVNIIPGVSGGTLAVVFGIYDKFVNAITLNVKKLWQNKRFVGPLLLGMAFGVLIFSKLIEVLYGHFPVQTNYFFTGLVIGSLPMLYALMVKKGLVEKEGKSKKMVEAPLTKGTIVSIVIFALIGFFAVIIFTVLQGRFDVSNIEPILPAVTISLVIRIFIAGLLGAVAMIVPGISGSLLMLMMGVYTIIVTSIPALFMPETSLHALFLLLPNGIGVILGLLCGAKLISWLLKRFPNATYACIFGLICGSVYAVFPGFVTFANIPLLLICIVCLAAGFCMAYFSSTLESKLNKKRGVESDTSEK